jgi:excisionase family DNA binding protein
MQLLSRAEVAEILVVPERTLAAWAYEGRGPRFYRVGRHARYDLADVQAWLASRAKEPEATTA